MKLIRKKESEVTMKRRFVIIAAMLAFLLCGCQTKEDTNISEYGNDIAKAQEIAVVSSGTSEVMEAITEKEDIENFVKALNFAGWTLKALPDEAEEIGSFYLSQEETIKLGQSAADGELQDICTITLYSGSYIGFEVSDLNMTFEVSEDTADYLNRYFGYD